MLAWVCWGLASSGEVWEPRLKLKLQLSSPAPQSSVAVALTRMPSTLGRWHQRSTLLAWLKPVLSRPGLNGLGAGEAMVSRGEDWETAPRSHAAFQTLSGTHQTQARWAEFIITRMPRTTQVLLPLPFWSLLDCRVVPSSSPDSAET